MRLKTSSYLVLGMLDRGLSTGYAVKRMVDRSTRFFWAASFAQVYPELAALERGGYVACTDDPHGARPRKAYRLTDRGQSALVDWLRSNRAPTLEFRDEGLLRLFFADALSDEDAIALVQRLRDHAQQIADAFDEEVLPAAEQSPRRFARIVAREGSDYFAWRARWFDELERHLVGQLELPGEAQR